MSVDLCGGCIIKKKQCSPGQRRREEGRIERRDRYGSREKWTGLPGTVPEANPLRKLGNLVHVSQCCALAGVVTALSSEGAVSRPAAPAAILPGLLLFSGR